MSTAIQSLLYHSTTARLQPRCLMFIYVYTHRR
nr:MAG TPA: hypothetical protein [Caudoviricetes sp.]